MGQIIEVKCKDCNYSAKFMTGAGLSDGNLNDVAARFKEDVAKHILYIQTFWRRPIKRRRMY